LPRSTRCERESRPSAASFTHEVDDNTIWVSAFTKRQMRVEHPVWVNRHKIRDPGQNQFVTWYCRGETETILQFSEPTEYHHLNFEPMVFRAASGFKDTKRLDPLPRRPPYLGKRCLRRRLRRQVARFRPSPRFARWFRLVCGGGSSNKERKWRNVDMRASPSFPGSTT